MSNSVATTLSILLGGAITWLVSWIYYKRSADELRREATTLRNATNAIIYIQQNPNAIVDVQRDKHGYLTGLLVNVSGSAVATSLAVGTLSTLPEL